jgi:aminoglycoside 3'-phosphotransferase I
VLLPSAIAYHVGNRRLVLVEDGQSGAAVYRICDDAADWFLKVGDGTAAGLIVDEAVRLRWLAGRLPAASIVAAVEADGAAWLLTTAVPGAPAGAYIKADRRRALAFAEAMAAFVSQLHALPVDDCPFDSSVAAWLPVVRQLVAEGRVDTEDFDAEHDGWSAERVLAKVEENACHAKGRVVVHGDFSLGNLIVDGDGTITGCIDVGRLGVGDPYRDLFIGWRDLGGFGQVAQAAFLAALGIDELDARRRELHRALDELF